MRNPLPLPVVFFLFVLYALGPSYLSAQQTDIPGPPGSEQFGVQVATLPNGNFVVTDPNYDAPGPIADVGRVYLYNGVTLALISTMTGTVANDFVGGNFSVRGVTVLANGDYVVTSSNWNGGRGAATLCNAATGCPAAISSANSLVGSAASDFVGGDGAVALPSGNYVVRSSQWNNGAVTMAGAITWCSGTTGCTGAVTTANSRHGTTAGDQIGLIGITVLSNGNYVTPDVFWDNGPATDAGAITFCTGTAACTGAVGIANSLVGTTVNEFTGNGGIWPLTNGNYVVATDTYDNGAATDAGAATFCSGTIGCTAAVGAANSLIGTTTNDRVSLNGVTALSNGNYVVLSEIWNNGATADVGAATFCNGTTGCVGVAVSTSNSLHGSTLDDGALLRATALTNGNYVVSAFRWDNVAASEINVGASTWCDGATGCTGPITTGNSLIGGRTGEAIGTSGIVALTNGNYVVASPDWSGPNLLGSRLGAATFCNGTTGCIGEVTAANSLTGTVRNDNVGQLVTPLTNGNYVTNTPSWDNGAIPNVGAVTFCSGSTGCTGPVTTGNSLIGATANDRVGGGTFPVALAGGRYVVRSPNWVNGGIADAGAITRCDASGCVGTPSPLNSLVGSTAGDMLGTDFNLFGLTALPNGNYLVKSVNWDNGGIVDAGAISFGFGVGGTTGPLTVNNSVRGTTAGGGFGLNSSFDAVNNQLVVGRPADNIVTVFTPVGPTAASVNVSGRVLTANGRGIAKARVTLTDGLGNLQSTLTSTFGYFRFEGVEAGETYIIAARHKRFVFNPMVVTVNDELTDLNLIESTTMPIFKK